MEIEILRKRLRMYLEAEEAILSGQSYSMEGVSLTRANLDTVRKQIASLMRALSVLETAGLAKRSRIRYVVPRL